MATKKLEWGGVITIMFILCLLSLSVIETTVADTSFTVIVLPDTQYYSQSYPSIFTKQTQWIADNIESMNIRMVVHEGDLVQTEESDLQWQRANTSMSVLDGVVPYSVVPGNHDSYPTTNYNTYFPATRYAGETWWGGSYNDNTNNYQLITIDDYDFIFVSLDWNATYSEINWVNSVLNTYSDRHAVLTTHAYLDDTTATRDGLSGLPNDSAEYIWNDLVKQHEKLFLVLCGHDHDIGQDGEARRTDTNNYGESVHQLLANYQKYPNGGNGWLRILNITIHDTEKNILSIKTYSPYLDEYATDDSSQFVLQFDGVGAVFPWTFPIAFDEGEEGGGYIPPNPTNLQSTTGDYWVNFTWDAGGGNETDSYNVNWNGTWYNNTLDNFMLRSVGECGWANISVYAYNSTGAGALSALDVSDEVQVTCPEGCGAATNPSPASGAGNVEPVGTKIRWTDECVDTAGYNVKFYRTEFKMQMKEFVSEGQSKKSWDPNIMFYNSHYFWQITTIREDGSTAVSPLWNFTTRGLGDDAIVDRNYSEPFENTFGTMNFSILQISDGVQAVYNNVIPAGLFYLFIFGLVFVSIWIRQANVLIPALLGIVLSPLIWMMVPIEYQSVAFWLLALSVGGILAAIFKSRM